MRSYTNVRIVKSKMHFSVYRGDVLIGEALNFADAWEIAKGL